MNILVFLFNYLEFFYIFRFVPNKVCIMSSLFIEFLSLRKKILENKL